MGRVSCGARLGLVLWDVKRENAAPARLFTDQAAHRGRLVGAILLGKLGEEVNVKALALECNPVDLLGAGLDVGCGWGRVDCVHICLLT
jgi:hypothetical protein